MASKANKANLGFPNYFIAQKARSKISQQEEKQGKQVLLQMDDKKEKAKRTKPKKQRARRRDDSMSGDEGAYDQSMSEGQSDNEMTVYSRQKFNGDVYHDDDEYNNIVKH